MEKMHFEKCFAGGKLVRGGNWFDERYSDKLGKNYSGMSLKKFVDPAHGYSTVGFRYVVHVVPVK